MSKGNNSMRFLLDFIKILVRYEMLNINSEKMG